MSKRIWKNKLRSDGGGHRDGVKWGKGYYTQEHDEKNLKEIPGVSYDWCIHGQISKYHYVNIKKGEKSLSFDWRFSGAHWKYLRVNGQERLLCKFRFQIYFWNGVSRQSIMMTYNDFLKIDPTNIDHIAIGFRGKQINMVVNEENWWTVEDFERMRKPPVHDPLLEERIQYVKKLHSGIIRTQWSIHIPRNVLELY